jgi:hypothetical protein
MRFEGVWVERQERRFRLATRFDCDNRHEGLSLAAPSVCDYRNLRLAIACAIAACLGATDASRRTGSVRPSQDYAPGIVQ